ncbi:MAG: hypothetical protein WDO68_13765 [Gammaproteobacteria bacterium]
MHQLLSVVQTISTGVSLIAFFAATGAWVLRGRSKERERLIRSAPPEKRAELVINALEFFSVDAGRLSPGQQFDLAMAQIQARTRRFQVCAIVICFLAVNALVVSVYAISRRVDIN